MDTVETVKAAVLASGYEIEHEETRGAVTVLYIAKNGEPVMNRFGTLQTNIYIHPTIGVDVTGAWPIDLRVR